ncbi:hypothetical protein [Nocardioides sp. R-C-SC26]|uniref:hypothetical protein n=1 Tax=Nocardioides sp. R-C-SC26 TaxID=2870414 RepID=UPI001E291527|nr:hypothetical protein [Nocardioides sp. R-C-SC26]
MIGVLAILGVIVTWYRWVKPRWRRLVSRTTVALDSIVGRDPIVDEITGHELAPALPGIGQRMATVEEAVKTLADQHGRIDDIDRRVRALESASIERTVTRMESVQHLATVDRALQAHPPLEGDEQPDLD